MFERPTSAIILLLLLAFVRPTPAGAQQLADTTYRPEVARPAYASGAGPTVAIDEAHHEFHTLEGRYAPFARLLRVDGYVVEANRAPFSRDSLTRIDIPVIANALAEENTQGRWYLPTPSAFTDDEIDAVRGWVEDGGSLLLIADHMPFAGAAERLAAAFGLIFQNGFALSPDPTAAGPLVFRRGDGSLADHPITDGRRPDQRVDSVATFTGQAFRAAPGARVQPLLVVQAPVQLLLPEEAWVFSEYRTPRVSAAGLLQGAVVAVGRGRVAAFGEAAMFTAQRAGPQAAPVGMNHPVAADNARLALNVLHWLSGSLP